MKRVQTLAAAALLAMPLTTFAQVAHSFRQIEHSKLFENHGLKGHKLTEGQGDGGFYTHMEVPAHSSLPGRAAFFSQLKCQSDAIVLGKVVSQTSFLTPDESFVFTDVEISIVETIKDNAGDHLFPNQVIAVTRPGGNLQFNGRKIAVRESNFGQFSVGGQYLLFLKFLPTTLDYQALWDRTFELHDGLISALHKHPLWDTKKTPKQDPESALTDARSAAVASCK